MSNVYQPPINDDHKPSQESGESSDLVKLMQAFFLPFAYMFTMVFFLGISEGLTDAMWLGFFVNAVVASVLFVTLWQKTAWKPISVNFLSLPVILILAILAIVVTNILVTYFVSADQSLALSIAEEKRPLQHLFIVLGVAVAVPIIEEMLFRRAFFERLSVVLDNPWLSALVTAVFFAGWHMEASFFIPLFLLGFIFNCAYIFTGKLWVPILLHCLNNGASLLMIYFANN